MKTVKRLSRVHKHTITLEDATKDITKFNKKLIQISEKLN